MDDAHHGLLSEITTISETVRAGVAAILGSPGWSLSDAETRDAVEVLWRVRSQAEAAFLHLVRVLDDRPDALGGAGKAKVAATFLVGRLHVDAATAAADVRAAHALAPDDGALAHLGAALAAGDVSRQHVDVAVAAVAKLPKAALTQHLPAADPDRGADDADVTDDTATGSAGGEAMTGAQFVDRWLAHHARRESPRMLRAMAKGLRDRIDPDHDDRSFDPDAHLKRSLTLRTDRFTGDATLNARLTAPDATALAAFLRSATKPTSPVETVREEADGSLTTVRVADERSADMRRYDAVMGLFRAAFSARGRATGGTGAATAEPGAAAGAGAGAGAGAAASAETDLKVDAGVHDTDTDSHGDGDGDCDGDCGHAPVAADGPVERDTTRTTVSADGTVPVRLMVTATLEQVAAAATLAAAKTSVGAAALSRGETWDSHLPPVLAAAGKAHLDRVGDLDPHLLAYLSCTASVQRLLLDPNGQPLHLGRAARFASGSQRHAAAVRDGGCVIPYCACPAEDTDLHHLIHWALGGLTDLSNLVSLCGRHHQETHAGTWRIEIRDGVVWVQPPPWIDPEQRWLRAPARTRIESIQHAAEQLRLHLDDAA